VKQLVLRDDLGVEFGEAVAVAHEVGPLDVHVVTDAAQHGDERSNVQEAQQGLASVVQGLRAEKGAASRSGSIERK